MRPSPSASPSIDLTGLSEVAAVSAGTKIEMSRPALLERSHPSIAFARHFGIDRHLVPLHDFIADELAHSGAWELPALGAVTAPTAVLIRPDGYVAWVGDFTKLGLVDALITWFGPPTAA